VLAHTRVMRWVQRRGLGRLFLGQLFYPILSHTWVMCWVGRRGLVGDGQLEKVTTATGSRASPARGTRGVSAGQVKLDAAHVGVRLPHVVVRLQGAVRLRIPIGTWF
jgi:hypothetical protein